MSILRSYVIELGMAGGSKMIKLMADMIKIMALLLVFIATTYIVSLISMRLSLVEFIIFLLITSISTIFAGRYMIKSKDTY